MGIFCFFGVAPLPRIWVLAAVRWPAPPTKREAHRAGGRRRARLASNTGVRLRASDCNAPGRLRLAATPFCAAQLGAKAPGCLAAVIERKRRRGACQRHPSIHSPSVSPAPLSASGGLPSDVSTSFEYESWDRVIRSVRFVEINRRFCAAQWRRWLASAI